MSEERWTICAGAPGACGEIIDHHGMCRCMREIGGHPNHIEVTRAPTKETYTREQLLSDEAVERFAREFYEDAEPAHRGWGALPGSARARYRRKSRRYIEALVRAIDKGKGGEDG